MGWAEFGWAGSGIGRDWLGGAGTRGCARRGKGGMIFNGLGGGAGMRGWDGLGLAALGLAGLGGAGKG